MVFIRFCVKRKKKKIKLNLFFCKRILKWTLIGVFKNIPLLEVILLKRNSKESHILFLEKINFRKSGWL